MLPVVLVTCLSVLRRSALHSAPPEDVMRRLLIATSLLGLVSAISVFATQDPHATMTVGTASAARGATGYGALNVAAGSDAALSMQVAVINGAKPGKVVAFVAGSHGTEYTSIVALT